MKYIPAFPQGNDRVVSARSVADSQGMTLRDYFAAKALQGFLHYSATKGIYTPPDNELAKSSYDLADAMLKARGE
jgi:hypothetical protein